MEQKIDFVVTWVDGSDEAWLKERSKYHMSEGTDVRNMRYRDWDNLQYWFRAVEQFAPWVNKIHFVTWGHVPSWLNLENPKLNIVKHSDFIPEEYLPVFNSVAIEVHLHRIQGLSENFVYFCDDFFLMQKCKTTDFFRAGLPTDTCYFEPVIANVNRDMWHWHLYNDYSIYFKYIEKKQILKNILKYCNVRYKKSFFTNALNICIRNFFIHSLHVPVSLKKETFKYLWENEHEILQHTAKSRFRSMDNNSLEMMRGYQLITGKFKPIHKKLIVVNTSDILFTKSVIEQKNYKYICLNDDTCDDEFEQSKREINHSFEHVFPFKSSFEK